MKFTGDFETVNDENDCRVWATGICSIDENYTFYYGNSIDYFFIFAESFPDSTFYFHNLKFDGEFLINYLFERGYKWSNRRRPGRKEFTTLISDKGMFYSLDIQTETGNKIKCIDSLKIIPFSVQDIAKGFGLPVLKGKIDYNEYREPGHTLTEKEIAYLKNDVEIMARTLFILFHQGLKKMTQGSNALADYKKIVGKNFKRWFPVPKYDAFIRQSYKGGFTWVNPKYKGKDIREGMVLDVNSLYPWVMYECMLPFGEGCHFDGKYQNDENYPLYIQCFTCNFELKKDGIPTIQLKNNFRFQPTEYLSSSNGEDVTLYLTSVDIKLFLDNYDVYNIIYHDGWKFQQSNRMFRDYIDKWYRVKTEATISGNKAMRQLAKLMLNALYGKFGLNPHVRGMIPNWDGDRVFYVPGEEELREPIYIPIATFITAYARDKTIRSAMAVKDRFIYADTDSLHLIGTDIPAMLEIDDTRLGAWKIENVFRRARFIRAKSYIEDVQSKMKLKGGNGTHTINYHKLSITCAGMPKGCYKYVTWENFRPGTVFPGKLQQKKVKGGVVLKEIEFTLRG